MKEPLHSLVHRLSELDKRMREAYLEMQKIGRIIDSMITNDKKGGGYE